MFVRRKEITPEEKLLRVIEHPQLNSKEYKEYRNISDRTFSFIKSFKFRVKKIALLDLTNRLFFVGAGVFTIIFISILIKQEKKIDLELKPSLLSLEAKKEDFKKYVNLIRDKNVFQVDFEVKKEESLKEKIDLKLVGILSAGLGKTQVLIEGKDNKTYIRSEGEIVTDNIRVERIEQDKVILRKDDEIMELR